MKLKGFCKAKDTVNWIKRQPTKWEKSFTNPTSNRGLMSKIKKRTQNLDIRQPKNTMKIRIRSKQRILIRQNSSVVKEIHLRKCSTFIAIRKMQIKTTLRFHLRSVGMAKINSTSDSSCWQGCGATGTLLHWEWFVQSLWKLVWWFLRKMGINLLQYPALPCALPRAFEQGISDLQSY